MFLLQSLPLPPRDPQQQRDQRRSCYFARVNGLTARVSASSASRRHRSARSHIISEFPGRNDTAMRLHVSAWARISGDTIAPPLPTHAGVRVAPLREAGNLSAVGAAIWRRGLLPVVHSQRDREGVLDEERIAVEAAISLTCTRKACSGARSRQRPRAASGENRDAAARSPNRYRGQSMPDSSARPC